MTIRHAASRFRRTSIDGWNGTAWVPNVAKGTLLTNARSLSDTESAAKVRGLLINPRFPLPVTYTVIRLGTSDEIYIVGRAVADIAKTPYSETLLVRKVNYVATLDSFTFGTASSGFPTNPIKNSLGTYYCDRENVSAAGLKESPTVKVADDLVILPAHTPVDSTMELAVFNSIGVRQGVYEVEVVYEAHGMIHCRCLVKKTPTIDNPAPVPSFLLDSKGYAILDTAQAAHF